MRQPFCVNCGKKVEKPSRKWNLMCSEKCNKDWEHKDDKCKYCYKPITEKTIIYIDNKPYHIICHYEHLKHNITSAKKTLREYKKAIVDVGKDLKDNEKNMKMITKKYGEQILVEKL